MPKAYIIANITVTDPDQYATYRAGTPAAIARHGGRFLVRGGTIHPLEGALDLDRLVVIEFPSLDAAQTFYRSPEYEPLRQLREAATRSDLAIVEGVAD